VPQLPHQEADEAALPKEGKLPCQTADVLLELDHGDLCGPIMSATHGGRSYMLLLVGQQPIHVLDIAVLVKDEAPKAIKHFKRGRRTRARRSCG
jgi:hypothetical protein